VTKTSHARNAHPAVPAHIRVFDTNNNNNKSNNNNNNNNVQ